MPQLEQWLKHIGLEQYATVFEEAAIDFDVLPDLTEEHLKQLGLPLGHQLKLMRAVKALSVSPSTSSLPGRATSASSNAPAERRQLTVMFCDLVGSTELSQRMDPESLRDLMRAYQETCRGVIDRYQGYVAQYLGDGLMVYFGWPQAHENDAERALRTALEIVVAVKTVPAPTPLMIRIGITTGAVVVGETTESDVGASRLAVGETPNLAARLQSLAGADEIVIGVSTYRLAGAGFEYEDHGGHTLKGIVEPVQAYKVRGLRRVEGRFDASHTRQLAPLIGRASEISLLLDRWERAKGAEGQGVMLSSEAGIGKSHITRALRERIATEAHIALHYQCSTFHTNSAFYPIIEQFERAAQFLTSDTAEQKLDKMESLLRRSSDTVAEVAPLYAAMLSLPIERYPAMEYSPQQQKERTIAAQVNQVLGLAAQAPVLMVLEDAHWADPSTLETFASLLECIESACVLIVVTYRPEFTPSWQSQSRVTTLSLARLSRKDASLLAERVSGKPLPTEVLEQILAKTDGVPLFVEELTKAVMESGLMQDEGDRFIVTGPLPPLAIPSTLHDSLMARLDRLAPVKELVQLGAVIGREFSHKLIASLSPLPPQKLDEALAQLVASALVFRRGTPPDAIYVFKHALVQDAAYESILKSLRQQLHASVATTLARDTQVTQSDPGFLALQFDRAGLVDQALEWYMRAGSLAKNRFANIEALRAFERALALLQPGTSPDIHISQRIDAHLEIGMLATMLEGYHSEKARVHFVEAERLTRGVADVAIRFRVLTGIIQSLTWRRMDSNALREELIAIAEKSGDRVHRIYAFYSSGESHMFGGRYTKARADFEMVSSLYDEDLDGQFAFQYSYDPGLGSLNNLAYMQWETGYFDRALSTSDEFVRRSRKVGHPYSQAFALGWTSDLAYFMWLPDRVRFYADLGVEYCRRHGFALFHALCSFHQGWVRGQEGRHDEAIDQMSRALRNYREFGTAAIFVSRMVAQLASVYGLANRCDEGLRVLGSSPDRQEGQRRVRYPEISRIEGDLHLNKAKSDPQLAEHFYKEAIAIALEDENRAKQLRATTSLAKLWQSEGQIADAISMLQPLYESFTEGFDMPDMKNARALLESLKSM